MTISSAVVCLLLCVTPGPSTNNIPLRVDLTDGSVLIGEALVSNVQIRTSFAGITLPLDRLTILRFAGTNDTVAVRLRNGDSLSGTTSLTCLPVKTLIGPINIPVSMMRTVTISTRQTSLPPDLQESLLLYYSFDTDEGDKVSDLSGHDHTGTVCGAVWQPTGVVGGAFLFDGMDDGIVAGNAADLAFAGRHPFSLVLWFKTTDAGKAQIVFGRSVMNGHPNNYTIMVAQNKLDFFWLRDGDNRHAISKSVIMSDTWHHTAAIWDGTNSLLYVDGKLHSSADNSNHQPEANPCDTVVGKRTGGDMYAFGGMVDEVMVLSRPLSADDVRIIFESQNPK